GLRRNPEGAAAPHLMAALSDRVLRRSDDPEQRVEDGRLAGTLTGASHHQRTGTVVQEGRVADPQLRSEDRIVLVAGGADGVEAAVGLLQLARRDVERPAGDLVLPQLDGLAGRERRAWSERIVGRQQRWRWR